MSFARVSPSPRRATRHPNLQPSPGLDCVGAVPLWLARRTFQNLSLLAELTCACESPTLAGCCRVPNNSKGDRHGGGGALRVSSPLICLACLPTRPPAHSSVRSRLAARPRTTSLAAIQASSFSFSNHTLIRLIKPSLPLSWGIFSSARTFAAPRLPLLALLACALSQLGLALATPAIAADTLVDPHKTVSDDAPTSAPSWPRAC